MAESNLVAAGDDILASQFNNLRKDVLDPALGHEHLGGADEGNQLPIGGLESSLQDLIDNAMPKMGIVQRIQLLTSVSNFADSGLVDVVNFSGSGRVNSAHLQTINASPVNETQFIITVDGVIIFDTGLITRIVATIDEDVKKNISDNAAAFQFVSGTEDPPGSDLFIFKSSLRIQQRAKSNAVVAISTETTLDWAHN